MHDIDALLDSHDGVALAALVRRGEIRPLELADAAIARLERVGALNAVAETLYEQARAAARLPAATQGALAGVPTLIKDLFSPLRGARMANGSLAQGEARADLDCEVVARLRRAGCVFLGTTTSPEFGTSYTTESTRFGATANPWDITRSAGGSSGGAAALVAARAVPFAHGNDGGGSLRVPASCCGVFGLKPSRGRMPCGPLIGEGWAGMSIDHAITRSVRDSAALLDATAGADLGAPYAAPTQQAPFLAAVERDPGPLRIALVEHLAPWPTGPHALAAVRHSAELCSRLGHHVEPARLPVDLPALLDQLFDIIGPSTRSYLDMLGQLRGAPIADAELEPRTRVILREKGQASGARYAAAVAAIHALGRRLASMLVHYDLILTPALTREPPRLGSLDAFDETITFAQLIEDFHSYCPFTALFNASGQPAMSVPLYWSPAGLPIGAHFAARFGEEATLLALAAQLERAQPWAARVPALNANAARR
ncbi:amidase [Xanthomonas melonis]|uniref:Amidase n=1 Tax=Xanthomonas melonis TaxID=56456 RepID=A0ABS8NUL4_9XANT|nr:amidase family protein [Xanthomonas melonis]MCD0245483.1 amidase [Xanthomonas melonis]MCD0257787.1 amidase [Xanthomonas melonis]MCD0266005.1 amidase [Xanthomonas melonis]